MTFQDKGRGQRSCDYPTLGDLKKKRSLEKFIRVNVKGPDGCLVKRQMCQGFLSLNVKHSMINSFLKCLPLRIVD